jgi:hypothetical protein
VSDPWLAVWWRWFQFLVACMERFSSLCYDRIVRLISLFSLTIFVRGTALSLALGRREQFFSVSMTSVYKSQCVSDGHVTHLGAGTQTAGRRDVGSGPSLRCCAPYTRVLAGFPSSPWDLLGELSSYHPGMNCSQGPSLKPCRKLSQQSRSHCQTLTLQE